jgi:hypothetical protein
MINIEWSLFHNTEVITAWIQVVIQYATRQFYKVSSVENFLKRNVILGATNRLGLFPELAEMSRAAVED